MGEDATKQPSTDHSGHDRWYTPLTRVTPVSRALAAVVFIALPFIGFWLGVEHGYSIMQNAATLRLPLESANPAGGEPISNSIKHDAQFSGTGTSSYSIFGLRFEYPSGWVIADESPRNAVMITELEYPPTGTIISIISGGAPSSAADSLTCPTKNERDISCDMRTNQHSQTYRIVERSGEPLEGGDEARYVYITTLVKDQWGDTDAITISAQLKNNAGHLLFDTDKVQDALRMIEATMHIELMNDDGI